MFRRFLPVMLPLVLLGSVAKAQSVPFPISRSRGFYEPTAGLMISVNYGGKARVNFRDVGTLSSVLSVGDTTSEVTRVYHDGRVSVDARRTTDGADFPDDGRTNSWGYQSMDQVTEDGSGIGFHRYSALSDGNVITEETGAVPGMDVELMRRFGNIGGRSGRGQARMVWGGMLGFGVIGVNANTRASTAASLVTLTDFYSLDGAPAPDAPYLAPSSENVSVTLPSGATSNLTVDTTTFLVNRPYSRTETVDPGAAQIEGYWQVKGAYLNLRAGPWVRWNISETFSLRASVGISASFLGADFRLDERLVNEDFDFNLRLGDATAKEVQQASIGVMGTIDVELWLTSRTGFFAGAMYESKTDDMILRASGRTAEFSLSGGTGFRFGFTSRF